jgi:hypothetical protein
LFINFYLPIEQFEKRVSKYFLFGLFYKSDAKTECLTLTIIDEMVSTTEAAKVMTDLIFSGIKR